MIEKLTFLEGGRFTGIDDTVVNAAKHIKLYPECTVLGSIGCYIQNGFEYFPSINASMFRNRDASEIIRSGFVTDYTERSIVFISIARAMGIPAKYVEALEREDEDHDCEIRIRAFAEVSFYGRWRLYDPILGFMSDDLAIGRKRYCIIGVGLDFSEIYLKSKYGYSNIPVSATSMADISALATTARQRNS